mgnify:CR=1 FL=1
MHTLRTAAEVRPLTRLPSRGRRPMSSNRGDPGPPVVGVLRGESASTHLAVRASKSRPTSLVRSRLMSRSTRIAARPLTRGGTGRVRRRIDEAAEVEVGSSALVEAEVALSCLRRVRARAGCGDWLANADAVHRGRQRERERERDRVGEKLVRAARFAADGRDATEGPGPHALDRRQGLALEPGCNIVSPW